MARSRGKKQPSNRLWVTKPSPIGPSRVHATKCKFAGPEYSNGNYQDRAEAEKLVAVGDSVDCAHCEGLQA